MTTHQIPTRQSSRRQFLAATAAGAAAIMAAPAIATASRTSRETMIGEGAHQFRVNHAFAELPDKYSWQTTHNVALDNAGNLYVIHEGRRELKDHPSIFVFDPAGKFVRAFGSSFRVVVTELKSVRKAARSFCMSRRISR